MRQSPPGLTPGEDRSGASPGGLARRNSCLQRRDPGLKGFVLLAGEPGHILDGLEFLALDHGEIAQYALRLAAEQRLEFAPHALRSTGRIVHQPRDLVEKPVRRLHHVRLRAWSASRRGNGRLLAYASYTMAMVRRHRKMPRCDVAVGSIRCMESSMLVLPSYLPTINPVLVSIGPFAVRWYALAYIVGIIAGWFYARAIIASRAKTVGRAGAVHV